MRRHEQLQSAKIRNGQQQPHQQQQPAQLRHLRPSAHAPPTALPLTTFRVLSKSRLARDECRPDRPSIALRLRGEAALGPARPVSDRPVSARPGPVRPETEWDGPTRPDGVSLRVLPARGPRPPMLPSRSGGVRVAALVALEAGGVRTRPWPLDGAGGGIFRRFCLAGEARQGRGRGRGRRGRRRRHPAVRQGGLPRVPSAAVGLGRPAQQLGENADRLLDFRSTAASTVWITTGCTLQKSSFF